MIFSHLTPRLALSLVLIFSAAITSFSPLNPKFTLLSWSAVVTGAILSLLVFQRQKIPLKTWFRSTGIALDIALLSWIAAGTSQALVAVSLPSPHLPIHNLPGYPQFFLLAAANLAFLTVRLTLQQQEQGRGWAALLAAALFSSTLYLRSFAVLEAGPEYAPVFSFTLICIACLVNRGKQLNMLNLSAQENLPQLKWFVISSVFFLAVVFISVFFSPVPGESLDAWLRLCSLVILGLLIAVYVRNWHNWQTAAWVILIIAGILPVSFALIKMGSLVVPFGLANAIAYRLHPTEMGGANLIGRSVATIAPLALALTAGQEKRFYKIIGWIILAGLLFVALYARSWGGLFASITGLILYACLANFDYIRRIWHRLRNPIWLRGAVSLLAFLFVFGAIVLAFRIAPQLNVQSYNGRLIHWQGALFAWQAHPLVGSGLGNTTVYTNFSERISGLVETQAISDNPLGWSQSAIGRSLTTHSHNLFLEFAAGSGGVGLIGFLGFLVAFGFLGFNAWKVNDRKLRLLIAACLAGISAELAWGMQDVSWVTPPFFSFPVWGLVGLIVAANRLSFGESDVQELILQRKKTSLPILTWLLVLIAISVVLLTSLSSYRYIAGFNAFQQQRWNDAVSQLQWAVRLHPLDPQPRQLLAESYLSTGELKQAENEYRLLSSLKRGYSPYLSQLGWMAWIDGDLQQATQYFEQAVELDPSAAWRNSLHLDLSLAYFAQGLRAEAVSQIEKGLSLYPQLASESRYWQPLLKTDGSYEVVLNTVYLNGKMEDLEKYIKVQLGVADFTDRQLPPVEWQESAISLTEVLESVAVEYHSTQLNTSSKAPQLLAALAEAYRQAGYTSRAEDAYEWFQEAFPGSAFGHRSLGELYLSQGFTAEAQVRFEQAIQVSPGDFDSRLYLASAAMEEGIHSQTGEELEELIRQSLLTIFRSHIFDPRLYSALARLSLEIGDEQSAVAHLSRVTHIRGSPEDALALAEMYMSLDQADQAQKQCMVAARDLLLIWPSAYDPHLWEVGVCLARQRISSADLERLGRQDAFLGNILIGHFERNQRDFDQAMLTYQAAAKARPDQAAPHYFLGETYQTLGNPDLAERAYHQATELDPLESMPMLALGRMQWSLGNSQAALESFRAAVEMTPGWADALLALGDALLALGDTQSAAAHFKQAYWLGGSVTDREIYHFPSALAEAKVLAPAPEYVQGDFFSIDGKRRYTLFMHPVASASFEVLIPENTAPWLVFDLALSPESWEQPGDGVNFSITIEAGGDLQSLFSAYIDPKNNPADRRWHPQQVDLSIYSGQTVNLIFATDPGPAGDDRFDWAGWGDLRLMNWGSSAAIP